MKIKELLGLMAIAALVLSVISIVFLTYGIGEERGFRDGYGIGRIEGRREGANRTSGGKAGRKEYLI